MDNKVFISACVLLLLLSAGFVITFYDRSDDGISLMSEDDYMGGTMEEQRLFQGAVPEGYDLEHFRQTGETILEDEE